MKSKILLATLAFVASCGGSPEKAPKPQTQPKSDSALLNCEGFSLLGDMALSGKYIHQLLNCASNQSKDGSESLEGILTAVNQLQPEGIQALIDFLLLPNPDGSSREETFPFLSVMNVILERGMGDGVGGFSLVEERLNQLQPFLLELDIQRSIDLVQVWESKNQLQPMLETLGLFLKSIENPSLSISTRELLAGDTIRPHLLPLAIETLKKKETDGSS